MRDMAVRYTCNTVYKIVCMYNLILAAGKQAAAKQTFVLRGGINGQMSDESGQ